MDDISKETLNLGESDEAGDGNWFLNYYRCEDCGEEWTDEWSCQCDDTCPECGARDRSPYKSEDIDGDAP